MKKISAILLISALGALFFVSQNHWFRPRPEPKVKGISTNYDVIIVGAGTGGSAAAIQAARMGAKVLLLEDTDWTGGQMTAAGVTSMDEGGVIADDGIYGEFINKVRQTYGNRPIGTCYWSASTKCFEPSVGQQVLKDMLASSGATLLTRTLVTGVTKSGSTITGVTTPTGSYAGRVVIDATEYGDVISLAGAKYRVGNSTSDSPNTSACIQDITYTAVIKKYPEGTPDNLKIKTPPPGYTDETKNLFARIVVKNPVRDGYPYNWAFHNGYRGMPDSSNQNFYTGDQGEKITKTGVNWANDYPALYPYNIPSGATNPHLSVQFLLDPGYRLQATCAAKLKTIQFLYYIQNELGQNDWSVANDENYNTSYNRQENDCPNIPGELKAIEQNLPQRAYVRESKRIVGLTTLTAPQVNAHAFFPNVLALADYGFDLHQCDSAGDLEPGLESAADKTKAGNAFGIPFEAFIPESTDGLVAAEKNISQSRLVNGGTRLQPSTMRTGQAAGAIAALAAKASIQPRAVNPSEVQLELLKNNDALTTTQFNDVPRTDANWPFVQLVTTRGLMQGQEGNFGVNEMLTRRQAAKLLAKRFNLSAENSQTAIFSDVPLGDPDRPAIEALYQKGITTGCNTNPRAFCPDDIIPRWQFAVLLGRALNFDTSLGQTSPIFADVAASDSSYPYIQLLYQSGLTIGCQTNPNKFCPSDPLLKSQAAIFLARSLVNTEKIAPLQLAGGQAGGTQTRPPNLWLDLPAENSSVTGQTTLIGWAIDNTTTKENSITKVEIYVDGNKLGDATYGSNRPDVCLAYPNRTGCPNVGYSYVLNTAGFTDGPHIVKIVATDSDASPKSSEVIRKLLVNNSGACKSTVFVANRSGFSLSPTGPVEPSLRVSQGQTFYAFADFGLIADSIWFNNSSNVQCDWAGVRDQPPSTPGWSGTAAVFACTAPAALGDYGFEAGTHKGTASNTCDAAGYLGRITVYK